MRFVFTIPVDAITPNQEKLPKKGKKINDNNFKLCSIQATNSHQKIKLYDGLHFAKLEVHRKRYDVQMRNSYFKLSGLVTFLFRDFRSFSLEISSVLQRSNIQTFKKHKAIYGYCRFIYVCPHTSIHNYEFLDTTNAFRDILHLQ